MKVFIGFCWFALALNIFALFLTIVTGGSLLWVNIIGIIVTVLALRMNYDTLKNMKRSQYHNNY